MSEPEIRYHDRKMVLVTKLSWEWLQEDYAAARHLIAIFVFLLLIFVGIGLPVAYALGRRDQQQQSESSLHEKV